MRYEIVEKLDGSKIKQCPQCQQDVLGINTGAFGAWIECTNCYKDTYLLEFSTLNALEDPVERIG
ncbi:hypothetical protein H0266_18405 [Halobacillus locisalis]|uniref:Uncharacterized protein n=1 Tax=Halobacillus locisalis TaxID=220753 RepID=A0A838CYS8_9BACI|nr:hypothetical protein [Halobacillus locisalis]MBA2176855.1 hypothetical protein [Halobacillus locisalis]